MDALLQNRLNSDKYLKKLVLKNESIAEEMDIHNEYVRLYQCISSKKISFSSTPYDPSYLCLQNNFSKLSFADAQKITLSLLGLIQKLEDKTAIKTGWIDPRCIFYSKSKPGNICICNAWNFQIGPLLQTWNLTAKDEHLLSFMPLSDEQCLESHIALAVRIMIAGKNNIEDLSNYATMLTQADSIDDLIDKVSAMKPRDYRRASWEDILPDEMDVVYCIIPKEGESTESDKNKLFKALLKVKCEVSRMKADGCTIYERFVYPMPGDRMMITGKDIPFSPDNVVDVFSPELARVNRAKISAAALTAHCKRPVFLYIIAASAIPGNTANCNGQDILAYNPERKSGCGKIIAIVSDESTRDEIPCLSNEDISLCCLRSSL